MKQWGKRKGMQNIGEYIKNETPEQKAFRVQRMAEARLEKKKSGSRAGREDFSGLRITVCSIQKGRYIKESHRTVLLAAEWSPEDVQQFLAAALKKAKENGGLHSAVAHKTVIV